MQDEGSFRAGIDDVIIVPLAAVALAVRRLARAVLSLLIHILDYAFPILLQLARFPLFTARILGDGIVAILKGIVSGLPVAATRRAGWRELIAERWAWIRRRISYRAFEEAVHHAFESGMEWVFRKCRNLSPRDALLVILGAVLWLPVSFGAATVLHAVLLAKATSLPAWMQLLHPFATVIAKSKLLVLPVYPAAWPQAKKHALVQAIGSLWGALMALHLVGKAGYRYRQTEHAAKCAADAAGRAASRAGLGRLSDRALGGLGGVMARVGTALRDAASSAARGLSQAPLIGPVIRSYAARYESVEHRDKERLSERMRGFFARWSIKLSAEYYEAKDRHKAAAATPEIAVPDQARPT